MHAYFVQQHGDGANSQGGLVGTTEMARRATPDEHAILFFAPPRERETFESAFCAVCSGTRGSLPRGCGAQVVHHVSGDGLVCFLLVVA